MPDEATETREELHGDGHGPPDKSPRRTEVAPRPQRAEVTNYEIVGHWFGLAAERLGLRDDIAAVLRSYREVRVQLPVKLSDGKIHVFSGYRVQHNGARPLQGRNPLPPRGRPRRGAGARRADDVENGNRRTLRRREGRRQRRTAQARAEGAPGGHALVHGQGREGARPHARHPRSRRGHRRSGHGLADGPVREAARTYSRLRTGKPIAARGLLRPRSGHRAGRRLRVPRSRSTSTSCPRRRPSWCRASATSARGRHGSCSSSAPG